MQSLAPLRAIVWAQSRTSRNFFLRANKGGLAFKWLTSLLWYAIWLLAAAGTAFLVSGQVPMNILEKALPGALFLIFFFWQLFPIILASQGAFLDLRKLLVYPIPPSQLFLLEIVLRVSTAIEMILPQATGPSSGSSAGPVNARAQAAVIAAMVPKHGSSRGQLPRIQRHTISYTSALPSGRHSP